MRNFIASTRGSVSIVFAITVPVLGIMISIGLNKSIITKTQSSLQRAADSAALGAARSLNVPTMTNSAVAQTVTNFTASSLQSYSTMPPAITTVVDSSRTSVTVTMSQTVPMIAGSVIGMSSVTITAKAVAKLVGGSPLCLVTLDKQNPGAMHLETSARLLAPACAAISNSVSQSGLQADSSAYMLSSRICSAGGYVNNGAMLSPTPSVDCVAMPDPLASLPSVTFSSTCVQLANGAGPGPANLPGGAAAGNVTVTQSPYTLSPGTYCGGLHISGNAQVTLNPGVYVIKDGPLVVDGQSTITGQNVGFYFTGNAAGLRFDPNTTISLSAPVAGSMAGFLFREDPTVTSPVAPPPGPAGNPPAPPAASPPMRQYDIRSNNARTMLGTIYLPVGRITIGSAAAVADQSAYTVIVCQQLDLFNGPNLQLNTNYGATTVPVPNGVGPTGGATVLAQ